MHTLKSYLAAVYLPSKIDLKPNSAEQLNIAASLFNQWASRDVLLSELSPELVTDFLRSITPNRSPRTVNNKRASIIAVWRHAARKGLATRFDPADIPRCKVLRRHPTAWTADEVRLIVANIRRPWLKTLAAFLYETGARLSSACLLTWEDWSPTHRMMRLPAETAKTGCEQFVRVSPQTAEQIESLRGTERIFPCPKHRRSMWRELKSACKRAGLPHGRRDMFQKLRRTTATLVAAAASVEAAAKQLGHTSTKMTLASYIDPRFLPTVYAADVLPPL